MKEDKPLAKDQARDLRDLREGHGNEGLPRQSGSDMMRDAIGAHPIGTSVGAVGGIAAGAAIGVAAGPVGSLVGAVVGGIAGTIAGGSVGEMVNPTAEDDYWRENYLHRPYVLGERTYEDYAPAYRYGIDAYAHFREQQRDWDSVETDLSRSWTDVRGDSPLDWNEARPAVRDAWDRMDT